MKLNSFSLKKQEAENILQKLLQIQTMQMIFGFSQIHLLKWNLCCIALNWQQGASTSL